MNAHGRRSGTRGRGSVRGRGGGGNNVGRSGGGSSGARGSPRLMYCQQANRCNDKKTNGKVRVEEEPVLLGGKMENTLDCAKMLSKCCASCTKLRRKSVPTGQPVLGGLKVVLVILPLTSAAKTCLTEKSYHGHP